MEAPWGDAKETLSYPQVGVIIVYTSQNFKGKKPPNGSHKRILPYNFGYFSKYKPFSLSIPLLPPNLSNICYPPGGLPGMICICYNHDVIKECLKVIPNQEKVPYARGECIRCFLFLKCISSFTNKHFNAIIEIYNSRRTII